MVCFQKNDITAFHLKLQEEELVIKLALQETFGARGWLDCREHIWLDEEQYSTPATRETALGRLAAPAPPNTEENRPRVMTNQEVLGQYWELGVAARLISLAFQKVK